MFRRCVIGRRNLVSLKAAHEALPDSESAAARVGLAPGWKCKEKLVFHLGTGVNIIRTHSTGLGFESHTSAKVGSAVNHLTPDTNWEAVRVSRSLVYRKA